MHELGIVYEVIRIVDRFASEHQLTQVTKIVLEIGQLSQAIPCFIEECFSAAVDNSAYAKTDLEIIVIPAVGICRPCGTEHNVVDTRRRCPACKSEQFTLKTGQEFAIKEIVAC